MASSLATKKKNMCLPILTTIIPLPLPGSSSGTQAAGWAAGCAAGCEVEDLRLVQLRNSWSVPLAVQLAVQLAVPLAVLLAGQQTVQQALQLAVQEAKRKRGLLFLLSSQLGAACCSCS